METKETNSYKKLWLGLISLSSLIFIFLLWWIYAKEKGDAEGLTWVSYLPYLNCGLNAITSMLLCLGIYFIKKSERLLHRNTMIAAATVSALFLVSYLTYHHFQGDTKFMGQGLVRPIYFFILISHVILSMVQVPLILATFTFAGLGKWSHHKKFAKVTFPIWLYVSITGVVIFLFLKSFN